MEFTITLNENTMNALYKVHELTLVIHDRKKKGLDMGLDSARINDNYKLSHISCEPSSVHHNFHTGRLCYENILFDILQHTWIEMDDYIFAMEQADKERRKMERAKRKLNKSS